VFVCWLGYWRSRSPASAPWQHCSILTASILRSGREDQRTAIRPPLNLGALDVVSEGFGSQGGVRIRVHLRGAKENSSLAQNRGPARTEMVLQDARRIEYESENRGFGFGKDALEHCARRCVSHQLWRLSMSRASGIGCTCKDGTRELKLAPRMVDRCATGRSKSPLECSAGTFSGAQFRRAPVPVNVQACVTVAIDALKL
jgi:hypothetical protein